MPQARFAKTALPALALILALATATTAQPANQSGGQTWAVVIGISRYPKIPGGLQLQFAERDAVAFANALRQAGLPASNLRLLAGNEATLANIKSALGHWLSRAAPADTVYIFFSGHGIVEPAFGESYLLAVDSNADEPYATGLPLREIGEALAKRVRAGRVIIFADAVRRDFFNPEDDGAARASTFVQSFGTVVSARPGLSALLASGPGEHSREGRVWGEQGVFTKYLIDAIAGQADRDRDGAVTDDEVYAFTLERVSADTSNRQHPWRSGSPLGIALSGSRQPATPSAAPTTVAQAPVTRPQPQTPSPTQTQTPARPQAQPTPAAPSPQPARPASTPLEPTRPAPSESPAKPEPAPANPRQPDTEISRNAPEKPPARPAIQPPSTSNVGAPPLPREAPASGGVAASTEPPPRPAVRPPSTSPVGTSVPASNAPPAGSVPVTTAGSVPSPLALEFEAALRAGQLIEPRDRSAWDIYQRMARDPSTQATAEALKPKLAESLVKSGREIVTGDVRGDEITERVDDFRRAGQLFSRARSLGYTNEEVALLERLSAAQALVALQFYDEAERSLEAAQGAPHAGIENLRGIIYQGQFDTFRAERAFKRAIELAPEWAAPHYNLGVLYREQKNEAALQSFAKAAELAPNQPAYHAALGDEYFARQQWPQAAAAYRKACDLQPDNDDYHTKLGHALFSQGLRKEADAAYEKARQVRARRQ